MVGRHCAVQRHRHVRPRRGAQPGRHGAPALRLRPPLRRQEPRRVPRARVRVREEECREPVRRHLLLHAPGKDLRAQHRVLRRDVRPCRRRLRPRRRPRRTRGRIESRQRRLVCRVRVGDVTRQQIRHARRHRGVQAARLTRPAADAARHGARLRAELQRAAGGLSGGYGGQHTIVVVLRACFQHDRDSAGSRRRGGAQAPTVVGLPRALFRLPHACGARCRAGERAAHRRVPVGGEADRRRGVLRRRHGLLLHGSADSGREINRPWRVQA
mmetsp:Transcript_386/g.1485  ORF Transcript_386/g.1485 Transcript_386/m.1485 type:complete len:271 (-) Transcript_386:544-1356(-)